MTQLPDDPPDPGPDHHALDGNAAAGLLRQVFAADITAAVGRCTGCGRSEALGGALLYGPDPGVVLRCRGCRAVLLRLVITDDRAWLDLRGLAVLGLSLRG